MKFNFLIIFLLIFSMSFLVVAQEESKISELISFLGTDENITASGIDWVSQETSEKKEVTISFTEEDSFLKIANNTFENIQPSSEEQDAFVKLDENGKIIGADFMTNEEGGTYNFLGEDIFVPANSQVLFDGNQLKINVAEGSEFEEGTNLFDLVLNGSNVKLPGGQILDSGELSYDSNGNAFVDKGKNANIDGVNIFANKKLNVDFEGKKREGNYISLGEGFYFGGSNNPGEVVFEGENKYFKNMKENDRVKFSLGEKESEIKIVPNKIKSYPGVYCENEYSIETGQLTFVSDGARIFKRTDYEGDIPSVRMDIYSSVGGYDRLINIGSNSNYASFIDDEGIPKEISRYNKYLISKGEEINNNVYDAKYTNRSNLVGIGQYLSQAQEVAKKELIKEKPHCERIINEACSIRNNNELERYVSNNPEAQNCYLSASKRKKVFDDNGYENYASFFEFYSILEGVTSPTWGTKEEAGRINELNIGIREICKVYAIGVAEEQGEPIDLSVISSFLDEFLIILKLLNQGLI